MDKTFSFSGDHSVKVDSKGRIVLPSLFKKQMEKEGQDRFIARKDFHEECLLLYPVEEWDKLRQTINENTNPFSREDRDLKRKINKNVFDVPIAENGRMLIPKRFLEMAGIGKEVIIAGQYGYIEVWDKSAYDGIDDESSDFSSKLSGKLGS